MSESTATEKSLYDWVGSEPDCPDDLIINAGNQTIIIGATGVESIKDDPPRINVGDRRRGPYYVKQIGLPTAIGLQRVKALPEKRLLELEKARQVRTGERPPDWVIQARERARRGEQPPAIKDATHAMGELQRAAAQSPGAFGVREG